MQLDSIPLEFSKTQMLSVILYTSPALKPLHACHGLYFQGPVLNLGIDLTQSFQTCCVPKVSLCVQERQGATEQTLPFDHSRAPALHADDVHNMGRRTFVNEETTLQDFTWFQVTMVVEPPVASCSAARMREHTAGSIASLNKLAKADTEVLQSEGAELMT